MRHGLRQQWRHTGRHKQPADNRVHRAPSRDHFHGWNFHGKGYSRNSKFVETLLPIDIFI
jgi:hypothetical protein